MAKKRQDTSWHHEHGCISRLGGVMDCFYKAVIKLDDEKKYSLRVYGLNEPNIVTIQLQTKSEKKAKEIADSYIESINIINLGSTDESDMH